MKSNVNLKKWAKIVKQCRGRQTLKDFSIASGLSESTLINWEQARSAPNRSSVDTLIAASPHINANKILLAAGYNIEIPVNYDMKDELRLGKLLYEKLVNRGLESYDIDITEEHLDFYSEVIDSLIDLILKTKNMSGSE